MSPSSSAPPSLLGGGRWAEALELPADAEAFHREGIARGWSDGLPLIPPTEERVDSMLRYCDLAPLDVLAVIAPGQGEATVQAVAVNAVMAGCEPRHFPIVVAAVRGLANPAFNIDSVNATTHPCAIFVLVNGPVGPEVGIHSGSGCFGPDLPRQRCHWSGGATGAPQRWSGSARPRRPRHAGDAGQVRSVHCRA